MVEVKQQEKLECLRFKLEIPYLSTFRKPFSTISILSYSIPPFTTIQGLLANALGLRRDSYYKEFHEKYKISLKFNPNLSDGYKQIKNDKVPEKHTNMVLMKKLKRNTPSSPFIKEYINPISYSIFILGHKNDLNELRISLDNPERPLYIGESDTFAIVMDVKIIPNINEVMMEKITSIYFFDEKNGKIQPKNKTQIIGRVPFEFKEYEINKKRDFYRIDKIVAVPEPSGNIELTNKVKCYKIEDDYVFFGNNSKENKR